MNIKTKAEIKSVLKISQPNGGWGFCIGAGTSFPIFPTWNALVYKLIKRDISLSDPKLISESLQKKFSPDTLIQAVQNKLNLSDHDFSTILTEELYFDLKSKVTAREWESIKIIFESRNPHLEKDPIWRNYIKVRDTQFNDTSAYVIAKFVMKTIEKSIPPEVVIS